MKSNTFCVVVMFLDRLFYIIISFIFTLRSKICIGRNQNEKLFRTRKYTKASQYVMKVSKEQLFLSDIIEEKISVINSAKMESDQVDYLKDCFSFLWTLVGHTPLDLQLPKRQTLLSRQDRETFKVLLACCQMAQSTFVHILFEVLGL